MPHMTLGSGGVSIGPSVKKVRTGVEWIKSLANASLPKYRLEQHFLFTILAPVLLAGVLYTLQHRSRPAEPAIASSLRARDDQSQCQIESSIEDTCSYVRAHCPDFDDDGLIPYFRIYYCASPAIRPYLLVGLFMWLTVLFASMAMAAGEFLSIHVGSIVSILGISENLAGVTLFAFGNGSSDLFSTLAAMSTNSGSLAINELFGAAGFIATVVFGLVAVTRPFSVHPHSFVGDVIWFIISASCLTAFLADGRLVLGECLGIIGLYLAFVFYAIIRPQSERESLTSTSALHAHGQDEESDSNDSASEQVDESTELLNSSDHNRDAQCNTAVDPVLSFDLHESPQSDVTSDRDECSTDALAVGTIHHPAVVEDPQTGLPKLFAPVATWSSQSGGEKTLTLLSLPLLVLICLTTPGKVEPLRYATPSIPHSTMPNSDVSDCTSSHEDDRVTWRLLLIQQWTMGFQIIVGFQLLALVFISQISVDGLTAWNMVTAGSCAALLSALSVMFLLVVHRSPSSRLQVAGELFASGFGFTVSLAWIYLTATSAVSLLKTLGFVLRIPTAILGATIFAIGNSSNDLVANTAVARRGFPVLAASACIGGPMMNMLLGIGIGGLVQVLKGPSHGAYSFEISDGLFLSAANLIGGLSLTLVYAFCNSWRLDARLGLILIAIWSAFIVGNVVVGVKES